MVALAYICCGTDEKGLARKQLAMPCIHAIVAGMEEHPEVSAVQETACATLGNIASNIDTAGLARKETAVKAGAFPAIVNGMKRHAAISTVQDCGCFAIGNLVRARGDAHCCVDVNEEAMARKQSAVEQGCLDAVIAAMKGHPNDESVQEHGARALANLTFKNEDLTKSALAAGAATEWLEGLTTARASVPSDPQKEMADAADPSS